MTFNLKADLDKLAASIAKHAVALLDPSSTKTKPENPISLQESVDAFKALVQYHALNEKGKKKGMPDDGEEESFIDFTAASQEPEHPNGRKTKIPGRRADA